jgi:hypothetical protein
MFHYCRNFVRPVKGSLNRRRVRLAVEALEDRTVPATFTVTSLSDGSAGSLSDAINQANAAPDADTIVFAPSLRGGTVNLSILQNISSSVPKVPQPAGPSALLITSPITIEGTGETIARAIGARAFRLFQVTGDGNLTLHNLTLSNGLAQGGAGGVGGGSAGLGGAIYNQGTLTILGCTLTGNQAVGGLSSGIDGGFGGGGLGGPADAMVGMGGDPNGGAAGTAGFNGGFGGGGSILGGNGGAAGFGGGGGGSVNVGIGGFGGFGGGGGGNYSGNGGNGVPGFGGGFGSGGVNSGFGGGGAGMGGAVFNQGGTVTIANSTLTDNTAQGGSSPAGAGAGFGGGLFNLNGTVTLTNATIAANTVLAGGGVLGPPDSQAGGGAVYNLSLPVLAYSGGPSATGTQNATLTVANSILANSAGNPLLSGLDVVNEQHVGTARIDATGPNIVSKAVKNLAGTLSGTFTVADPRLGPLQNNGGPTPTMALLPGSPALNAGSNAAALAAALTADQRGFGPRAAGGTVDIGAFEVGAMPPVQGGTNSAPGLQRIAVQVVKKHGHRQLRVFDTATGALKFVVFPFGKSFQGNFLVTTGDVNGDGVEDAIARVRRGHKFLTRVFSGRDGARLA